MKERLKPDIGLQPFGLREQLSLGNYYRSRSYTFHASVCPVSTAGIGSMDFRTFRF